jgi:predicted dehydrogenase
MPHSERLELYGTRGGILVDQLADPVVKVFRGHQDFSGRAPEVHYGPDGWHPGGWHYESVISEVTDYVESLVGGRPPLIDNRDAAYAIWVVDAAYRSIAEGRPVEVSTIATVGADGPAKRGPLGGHPGRVGESSQSSDHIGEAE